MLNWGYLVVFTVAIELFTIILRFVFKLSSKVHHEKILRRFGMRWMVHIHHMYFGIILVVYTSMNNFSTWFNFGLALIISDLLHHFFVLKLVEGDSEFNLIHKI